MATSRVGIRMHESVARVRFQDPKARELEESGYFAGEDPLRVQHQRHTPYSREWRQALERREDLLLADKNYRFARALAGARNLSDVSFVLERDVLARGTAVRAPRQRMMSTFNYQDRRRKLLEERAELRKKQLELYGKLQVGNSAAAAVTRLLTNHLWETSRDLTSDGYHQTPAVLMTRSVVELGFSFVTAFGQMIEDAQSSENFRTVLREQLPRYMEGMIKFDRLVKQAIVELKADQIRTRRSWNTLLDYAIYFLIDSNDPPKPAMKELMQNWGVLLEIELDDVTDRSLPRVMGNVLDNIRVLYNNRSLFGETLQSNWSGAPDSDAFVIPPTPYGSDLVFSAHPRGAPRESAPVFVDVPRTPGRSPQTTPTPSPGPSPTPTTSTSTGVGVSQTAMRVNASTRSTGLPIERASGTRLRTTHVDFMRTDEYVNDHVDWLWAMFKRGAGFDLSYKGRSLRDWSPHSDETARTSTQTKLRDIEEILFIAAMWKFDPANPLDRTDLVSLEDLKRSLNTLLKPDIRRFTERGESEILVTDRGMRDFLRLFLDYEREFERDFGIVPDETLRTQIATLWTAGATNRAHRLHQLRSGNIIPEAARTYSEDRIEYEDVARRLRDNEQYVNTLDDTFAVNEEQFRLRWRNLPVNSGRFQFAANVVTAMQQAYESLLRSDREPFKDIERRVPDAYQLLQHDDVSYMSFASLVAAHMSELDDARPIRDRGQRASAAAKRQGIDALRKLFSLELVRKQDGKWGFRMGSARPPGADLTEMFL